MLCIGGVSSDQSCSLDETYGTQLVALPSLSSASTLKSSSSAATTVTLQPGSEFDSGVDVSFRANAAAAAAGPGTSSSYSGFFEGIFGCLRPVWSVIGKATSAESKQKGDCFSVFWTLHVGKLFSAENIDDFLNFLMFFSRMTSMRHWQEFSLLPVIALIIVSAYVIKSSTADLWGLMMIQPTGWTISCDSIYEMKVEIFFSCFQNTDSDMSSRNSAGMVFHTTGPLMAKLWSLYFVLLCTLSSYVEQAVVGTWWRTDDTDHRVVNLVSTYSSERVYDFNWDSTKTKILTGFLQASGVTQTVLVGNFESSWTANFW